MDALHAFASQWPHILWSMSWQVAVLAAFVWVVSLLCRRATPNFRYWLWMVVLIRLCLPVDFGNPFGIGGDLRLAAEQSAKTVIDESVAVLMPESTLLNALPASKPDTHTVSSTMSATSWGAVFAYAWAIPALGFAALVMYRRYRVRGLLQTCAPVARPELLALLAQCARKLGVRRPVRLLGLPATQKAGGPAVIGVMRPTIVLPPAMAESWSVEDLEPILLHELAHVRRNDLFVNLIQIALQTVYFFHPVVWYVNARIRHEREMVCDDLAVLHSGGRQKRYGRSMLRVIEETNTTAPALWASGAGITERRSSLSGRILRMTANTYRIYRPLNRLSLAGLLLLAVLGTAIAAEKAAQSAAPIDKAKAEMMGRVEDFFLNNFRDVTSRKSLEWGDVATDAKGNSSIRYKYQASIWDKQTMLMNQVFTFDAAGKYIEFKNEEGFPQEVVKKPADTATKEGMQALVEDFFGKNYRDITARKTIEWGEPAKLDNGNATIRYKYEATIWDKDKIVQNKVFTFNPKGEFVSVEDAEPAAKPQ
ncbi:MAG: M56 family metallopeptidase [Candidatus Hydrogenedentales bacterium]|jgi:beta-lactamase regulating signal transducer with metallopeptidase domain